MVEKTVKFSETEDSYKVLIDIELIEMGNGKLTDRQEAEENERMKPQLQNSRYCTFLLLFTVSSSIPMVNYGVTCFNPVIPVLREMYNESYFNRYGTPMPSAKWEMLKALTMSMVLAGAFVGCFLLKAAMTCLTRKKCMLVVHYINLAGAAIIAAAGGLTKAYEPVIIGRFLMGLASGMALGLVPVIVGETCVKHRRAVYDGLVGVLLAVGAFFGVFFGWSKVLGTTQLWPLIVIIPAVPSLIYIVLSVPETPYQIMKTGDRSAVTKLMKRLRAGPEEDILDEINFMWGERPMTCEEESHVTQRHDITLKEVVGIKQYRRQFIMVLLLFANLMLSGLNNVLLYSDQIFLQAGIDENMVTVATICVFLFQVFATLPGSFLLHHVGSWALCIAGNLVMIVGHVLIVVSLTFSQSTPWISSLAVIGVAVYLLGFGGGGNIGIFPLVGELTTERTRPICVNFGTATLWFTGWLVGFMSAYFQKWLGPNSFLVWMAFTIIFTIYIMIFVPNTKKKSSNEIQMRFKMD